MNNTPKQLADILAKHRAWCFSQPDGACAYLRGANLRDANLSGAYLSGANLRDANLRGAHLRDANLRDAYLRGAHLRGADLRDADLSGAYLSGADLRGANLRDANLRDAYLSGAYLSGADLRGADLRGANLSGANLRDAKHICVLPVGDDRGYMPIASRQKDGWRVFSGCRSFSLLEAHAHWGHPEYHTPWLGHQYVHAVEWLSAWSTFCGLNDGLRDEVTA